MMELHSKFGSFSDALELARQAERAATDNGLLKPTRVKTLGFDLAGDIEAGALRSVIGASFPLDEIVAAHRYAESGRKLGNVVVTVTQMEAACWPTSRSAFRCCGLR
jgi:NADPH:quinone reductase-like Zn-dependent oxidoreductase